MTDEKIVPVVAVQDGTLLDIIYDSSYGNAAVVQYVDGSLILYRWLALRETSVPKSLKKGSTIGYVVD